MSPSRKTASRLTAKDVMTERVLTVSTDWPVEQLAEFFVAEAISGAPVVNRDGELVGVVSLTDVARNDSRAADSRSADRHAYYLQVLELESSIDPEAAGSLVVDEPTVKVREIMTPVIIEVGEDTPVAEVAAKMIESRVHRLFVTRDEKVVGIITALDMMRVVRDLS
jgi:CBS domain-containing protein